MKLRSVPRVNHIGKSLGRRRPISMKELYKKAPLIGAHTFQVLYLCATVTFKEKRQLH